MCHRASWEHARQPLNQPSHLKKKKGRTDEYRALGYLGRTSSEVCDDDELGQMLFVEAPQYISRTPSGDTMFVSVGGPDAGDKSNG